MNRQLLAQLDKVLALVDSSHDGEALVAVRKARQMLNNADLSFGDLARAAQQKPRFNLPLGFLTGPQTQLESEVVHLRQTLEDLRTEYQMQEVQVHYWRQRATDVEQKLTNTQDEAARWRQLARETVEKLWDLGLAVQQYDMELKKDEPKKA